MNLPRQATKWALSIPSSLILDLVSEEHQLAAVARIKLGRCELRRWSAPQATLAFLKKRARSFSNCRPQEGKSIHEDHSESIKGEEFDLCIRCPVQAAALFNSTPCRARVPSCSRPNTRYLRYIATLSTLPATAMSSRVLAHADVWCRSSQDSITGPARLINSEPHTLYLSVQPLIYFRLGSYRPALGQYPASLFSTHLSARRRVFCVPGIPGRRRNVIRSLILHQTLDFSPRIARPERRHTIFPFSRTMRNEDRMVP